ncbi:MAG: 23S rRNA (uracil(1939)-C(5))-methyltransferase RlmD [Candidatus Gastranaerophilales bacterium]
MNENDEIILNIEKMSNLGYGIAKVDGQVVFVENACPGDEVKAKITKVNKNFANAKTVEVLTPSAHRVEPFCALQKVCGSCQLQFIDYEYQLELKKQIVEDAMRTIGNIEVEIQNPIASPDIREYRHKIQYPVSETKVSKRLLSGYYKSGTHEIVNIKHCPIQPKIVDEIVEFIKEKACDFDISGFNEKKHSGDLRHIVIRSSKSTGKNLVVLVVNATRSFERLKDFATCIFEQFKEVSGVCVNFNSSKTNVIMGKNSELLCGKDFIKEWILEKTFRIGASTFFQVNPKSAENIFRYVRDYIANNFENATVLDAYAGVTSFGVCVSDVCKKVVSVEENKEAVTLASEILELNEITNVELHNMDAVKYFAKEKRKFDAVILDPPRKGCTTEALDEAYRLSKGKIIYVSCNPATLARDLKYLVEKGSTVENIQPFDMFCHTYHIENVAIVNVNK